MCGKGIKIFYLCKWGLVWLIGLVWKKWGLIMEKVAIISCSWIYHIASNWDPDVEYYLGKKAWHSA